MGKSYRGVGTVVLAALGGIAGCSADEAGSPSGSGVGGMAGSPSTGGDTGSTGASGGSVAGCTAGQTQACVGADGCTGVQQCLPDGTAFGPCDCTVAGTGGLGTGGLVGTGGLGVGGAVVGAGGTGTGGVIVGAGGTGVGGLGTGGDVLGGGGTGVGGVMVGAGGTGVGGLGTGGDVVGAGGLIGGGGTGLGGTGTGGDGTGGDGTGGDGTGGVGTGGSTATWCGYTSDTITASLQSEYDSWKTSYYRDCGDGTACIEDNLNGRCVSEGVAYGMLLAVNMNDQDAFDRLWAYYLAHTNANGVMNWETATCGETWQFNGAADAELDAAMALIQADARWGGYTADATALVTIIRDLETEVCSGRIVLKAGDAWGSCDRINPSYFAPAYYRAFAQFVPDQAQHWNDMVVDTYELYDIMQTRMGGLYPDWVNPDGSDNGGQYWWEACRVPWRVATDYAWTCSTDAADSLAALDGWVDSNGGIAGVDRPANSCFRGGFALTGVSASQSELDTNVTTWLANSNEDTAYYQSTLRVLYMLIAAGQFPSNL